MCAMTAMGIRQDVGVARPEFHGPKDYLDLARSPEATADQLRELSTSDYFFVRCAVAEHLTTPPDVLANLVPSEVSTWNDTEMLLALARNSHSTLRVLSQIAKQVPATLHIHNAKLGFKAGIVLFEREDTPDQVLIDLLAEPANTTEFRRVAAGQTTHAAVREHLSTDRSERVRRAAGRSTGPPTV
jgi:hypothetical protein